MKLKVVIATIVLVMILATFTTYAKRVSPEQMTWDDGACRDPVQTIEGVVTGTGEDVSGVCSYKGIPYASPPVGDLRWASPQPAAKRSGVFEAVDFGPECSQIDMFPSCLRSGKTVRNEDCLYLNIWRPNRSGTYPVMVWIHGGGLTSGAGSEHMYWGDRLAAEKEVVVVTFNYRIGALGFLAHRGLATEHPESSTGNYGLMDQVAALTWVKNNIAAFGGDPENVTIFGESAGGRSVGYMLASPLAAGLFHKAIMQSGRCSQAARTLESGFEQGDRIAEILGCKSGDIPACMRSKPAEEVVEALEEILRREEETDLSLKSTSHFTPTIDGWVLRKMPIESLRNGDYNQAPLMVGSNRDEYKLFAPLRIGPGYRMIRNSKVKAAIERSVGRELLPKFMELYPYENHRRAIDTYCDAKTDLSYGCKSLEMANASSLHQPTYYYRFDYDDHRFPNFIGAAHGTEISFIFNALDRGQSKFLYSDKYMSRAKPLVDVMMTYWTNFAKTGDPNSSGLKEWPLYDRNEKTRMYLDLPQRTGPVDHVERCEFWKEHGPNLK